MQSSIIRCLFEALKDLLNDTVMRVTPSGIRITTMDSSHAVLVYLKLNAKQFEEFYCDGTRNIGINMIKIYRLLKTITGNDTVAIYMEKHEINNIKIRISNEERNMRTLYTFNLLDLPKETINIPPTDFTSVITLDSAMFQRICRNMDGIAAETIEIKNVKNQLILSCHGDMGTQETVISDTQFADPDKDDDMDSTSDGEDMLRNASHNAPVDDSKIFQGIYSLKYLVRFTKCTGLSSIVELYLENDYPLVLRYKVGSLGDIKLVISPISEDDE